MQNVTTRAQGIKIAVFDVDGVMTDGTLFLNDSGEEIKAYNVLDGHGLKMLKQSGVELAIITSRTSRGVERRAENLGITHLYQGSANKLETFNSLLGALQLSAGEASYMGDDLLDLAVLRRAGLAVTVPDAPAFVKQQVHYITQARGGHGAVRECCELIMSHQGTLQALQESYLD
jgi:3-deoxy-D-manno-octulosonate 8-phosphate phosphatase (KDO 8-P phosphatase)